MLISSLRAPTNGQKTGKFKNYVVKKANLNWSLTIYFLIFIVGLAIIAGAGADLWSDFLSKHVTLRDVWWKECWEMGDCTTLLQHKTYSFYGMYCSF